MVKALVLDSELCTEWGNGGFEFKMQYLNNKTRIVQKVDIYISECLGKQISLCIFAGGLEIERGLLCLQNTSQA